MQRVAMAERPDWKAAADAQGFRFHSMHGEPYWDETSAYVFTLDEIERDLEDPATELHAMCLDLVDRVVRSDALLQRFDIPRVHWDLVAESWARRDPALYGRFDFIHCGGAADGTPTPGPAKMIEYNADTPTSLFESAAFQWTWLEECRAQGLLPDGADQFNLIYESLVARIADIFPAGTDIHFASHGGPEANPEDYATTEMIAYAARDAGMGAHYTAMEAIGLTVDGQFADSERRVIGTLFKLYPWESMLREPFAADISASRCRFLEPPWKAILSNKAMLPLLWQMHEGHPNLLPAAFEDDLLNPGTRLDASISDATRDALGKASVTKPLFSREGASITIREDGTVIEAAADRSYDAHPRIVQAYHPQPVYGGEDGTPGMRPVLGLWVVGDTACGLGVREDASRITQDLSRFKPHYIMD